MYFATLKFPRMTRSSAETLHARRRGASANNNNKKRKKTRRAPKSSSAAIFPSSAKTGVFRMYVLESLDGKRTYVGVTKNMRRRLRQHNGELAGGAKVR